MRYFSFISQYLKKDSGELNILGKILIIGIVFLFAVIVSKCISFIIEKNLNSKEAKKRNSYTRIVTIMNLANKVTKVIIFFFALTLSMDLVGLNTSSIIAAFGVGSLAISFGAQSLIKDVINGFFIIIEDQYRVGDLVEILKYEGYVEDFGIRSTTLRDFNGEVHIIPNGKIEIVTNRQKGVARAKVVIPVNISESPKRVIDILSREIVFLEGDSRILSAPRIWGVTNNTDRGYEITVSVNTKSGEQFNVEYELREKIVELFIENNIELPEMKIRR